MEKLVQFLTANKDDRKIMSMLRHGLVPETEMRAWPLLAQFDAIGDSHLSCVKRTIAGLFAHHSLNCSEGNFGHTCLSLCQDGENSESNQGKKDALSRRFEWLLSSEREEVCERIIRFVLYAKAKNIPINYVRLGQDLATWPQNREIWAETFWGKECPGSQK